MMQQLPANTSTIENEDKDNEYLYVPQTINFGNDKDDFEAFQTSFIIVLLLWMLEKMIKS
jgi:hypothetical protein